MKITDIIVLESWENKFAQIRKEIQDLTVAQAARYLKDVHGITLSLQRGEVNTGETGEKYGTPMVGSGGSLDKWNSIEINVSGEWDQSTRVRDIKGLLNLLQHEMSHQRQDSEKSDGYTSPSTDTDTDYKRKWLRYITHPQERSQQVLDTGIALSGFNLTMTDFDKFISDAVHNLRAYGETDPNRQSYANEQMGTTYNSLHKQLMQIDFENQNATKYNAASKIATSAVAIAYAMGLGDKALNAKAKVFKKSLAKRFKSIDAHSKSGRAVSSGTTENTSEADFIHSINEYVDSTVQFIKNFSPDGKVNDAQIDKMISDLSTAPKTKSFYYTLKKENNPLIGKYPDIESLLKDLVTQRVSSK